MATVREIVGTLKHVDSIFIYFRDEEHELMNEYTEEPKAWLLDMLGDYLVAEFWGISDEAHRRVKKYALVVKEERRPLKREDVSTVPR